MDTSLITVSFWVHVLARWRSASKALGRRDRCPNCPRAGCRAANRAQSGRSI